MLRSLRVSLILAACLALAILASAQVADPTQVQFTCSADQATLTRYEVRSVVAASGSASSPVSVGLPTPVAGVCTVTISTATWQSGVAYRVQVRSVRGTAVSAWVATLRTGTVTVTEPPPAGTVYYVSTAGLDSRTCAEAQSISTPKRTIPSGLSCMAAGSTLLVRGGAYPALAYPNSPSGTSWANAITIASYPGETATIDGYIRIAGTTTRQYIIFDRLVIAGSATTAGLGTAFQLDGPHNHIRFTRGEIKDSPRTAAYINPSVSFFEYTFNSIHDNTSHGLYLSANDSLVEGNDFANNGKVNTTEGNNHFGVTIYQDTNLASSNNIIRNNRMHGSNDRASSGGISVASGSGNLVYNNLVYDNNEGISLCCNTPINTKIYNNTVYGNSDIGIEVQRGTGTIVRNNIIRSNGSSTSFLVSVTQSNNLTSDPLFVNAGAFDFHLQAGSPAINAGVAVAEVTTDFDGVSRGNPPEIGAYER